MSGTSFNQDLEKILTGYLSGNCDKLRTLGLIRALRSTLPDAEATEIRTILSSHF